ncbi:Methyltransferase type 12 [Syntrophomonas zehnderi OL-4]|uniref:Methyltransferase type 12 n=1 Tax=Syntrophomonas zehnderi OL-4 TaxID=690567 RepID=A0A0E3W3V3_9FIRM|nr:class I SAM-dependent methyltransferase [Syntrophomonas zehnderi]CFY07357.1 Methyltransferase type 12 [Syntrophomonas zehnderi OL-4]
MPNTDYGIWKATELTEKYLAGVRGAIPLATEQIDLMLRIIGACDIEVESILDLGCGDGILAASILQQYTNASGVLLDISESMIQAAKDKFANHNGNLDFVLFDFGNNQWIERVQAQGPFSVIISGFSIHHQTDERKQEIYAEIFELLTPGGLFLNLENVSSSTNWVSKLFDDLFIDSLYNMYLTNGVEKTRQEVSEYWFNREDIEVNKLAPVEKQCDWLRQIGFSDVDCYFKILEIALFGGRKPR